MKHTVLLCEKALFLHKSEFPALMCVLHHILSTVSSFGPPKARKVSIKGNEPRG